MFVRNTNETEISLELGLRKEGNSKIDTPNLFFNHMMKEFSLHGNFDITLSAKSLDSNMHHLIEDCAIVLGCAFKEQLGDKKGIKRYASFILPMDDALIMAALDISNRPYFKLDCSLKDEKTADFETVLFYHFFNTFAMNMGLCLHIKVLDGFDTHHIIEASFKAVARCLKEAIKIEGDRLPSTKGQL